MIRIDVDGSERALEDASERWIREDINRRLADTERVCVRVSIEKPPEIDFILPSADCSRFGGGRELTRRENEIWELWKKRGLNDPGLPKGKLAGTLWAFLHQVQRLV